MLLRRDCFRVTLSFLFLSALAAPVKRVLASAALPLGLDTLYRQVSEDGKSELICCTEVELTSGLVPGDRATTILADRIKINGVLLRPGIDLTLLAREIICGQGAKIDVSGPSPPNTDPKAQNGLNPGENGNDGVNGAPGARSGNVTIYAGTIMGMLNVQSNGGNGGAAQSGGDGAKGATGASWTTHSSAGQGGPGGNAGKAGTPGNGGDGGIVVVNTLDGSFAAVTAAVSAGLAGSPGMNGAPGAAGNGGAGGSGTITVHCDGGPCEGPR